MSSSVRRGLDTMRMAKSGPWVIRRRTTSAVLFCFWKGVRAEVVRARGKEEVEGVLDAAPLTERQLIPVIKAVHVVVMTCKSSTGCGRGRTSRPG